MPRKLITNFFSIMALLVILVSSAQAQLTLSNGYATGSWWNPAREGEGFYIEVVGAGDNLLISVAMYSYDEAGNQLWLVGSAPIGADDIGATVPVILVEGPVWGTNYNPADQDTTQFGNIVVQFPSCDSALFKVQSNVQGLESGSYSLVRLTEIVGMDCVEPPPPAPPPPDEPTEITPGLWTGQGVCFFVKEEGEGLFIDASDECDNGKSFSGDAPGTIINLTPYSLGNPDTQEPCNAELTCVGSWSITDSEDPYDGAAQETTCLNSIGGIGKIKFILDPAGVKAEVQIFEGESFEITNDICHAGRYGDLTATPAQ
jgi:hypothetical protein